MTDYQSLNEQVQTVFQESNQPNMYSPEFEFTQTLETLKPTNLDRLQSVRRMVNFINIILYLKTNKLNPCQIKFHHVGCDRDNNWGLKNVICYRAINSPKAKDLYENTEFLYHSDEDNQLVWNLGKVWLRFYTDKKITTIDKNQSEIDEIIQKNVTDQKISKLLRKMLKVNKDQRISFEKFIEDEVFAVQNFHQKLYSSICLHFQMVSKNQKVKNSLNNKKQIQSPYEEQLFRREMEQSLDICTLLEKSIQLIRNMYEKSVEIQFHAFIIKAEAYCILKNIDEKKNSNQIVDHTTTQKKTYSKFVTKMLTLKQELQRKMKMQIFSHDGGLNQDQRKFFMPTDQMRLHKNHIAFKNIVVNYYLQSVEELKNIAEKQINQELKFQKMIIIEKSCLIFLLSRLCNQIFSQLRSFIFEDYFKRANKSIFSIKQLLQFIDSCSDISVLRRIRNKVYTNGLQNNTSNQKIQTKP